MSRSKPPRDPGHTPRNIRADRGSLAAGRIVNSSVRIVNEGGGPDPEQARDLERAYLERLRRDAGALEWLASIGYRDRDTPAVTLGSVYTALMTTRPDTEDRHKGGAEGERRLSALAVLNREPHLVLTGDPGSGKSAFVNFLALCLAGEILGAAPGLKDLTEPLPQEDHPRAGKPAAQPWDRGAPIPVRVLLRDFAAAEQFPPAGRRGDAGHLTDFLAADLANRGLDDFWPLLKRRLQGSGGLLLLDGLDEVPDAGARRERLVQCIRAFADSFVKVRLLVTCRPYAYAKEAWRLRGFAETSLAELGDAQIERFVARWYATREELPPPRREARAQKLTREVLGREALRKLAGRPLLLTLTAYLHATGHELPERRALLYERLLELLIDKWERARFRAEDPDAARELEQYSLAEFLRVDREGLQRVLERLAFEAHADQAEAQGAADIPARNLTHALLCLAREQGKGQPALDAVGVSHYLRDRVGILHQRGGRDDLTAVYAFPHRSFQEFLAASHLAQEEPELFNRFHGFEDPQRQHWPLLAAWLGRSDPDRWREVVLLAGGYYAQTDPRSVWELVDALSPQPQSGVETTEAAWGLRLAGEILAESLSRARLKLDHQTILERIRDRLPALLAGDALTAAERVAAALHLAVIGDPRPAITTLDAMAFCRVPPGPFFLGATDREAYSNEREGAGAHHLDCGYWLARHPVSLAQFRAYLAASGREPGGSDCLDAPDNTPVVYGSWHEAVAMAEWLTQRWHGKGWLPEGWRVDLPSEPEWEKAAKGGGQIPGEGSWLVRRIEALGDRIELDPPLVANPEPRRPYPWGEEPNPERMNFNMNIGRVAPLGCYPSGRSPYGCEELAGNVWEWTRSRSAAYPYPEDPVGRAEREAPGPAAGRVLRGGAFNNNPRNARCSYRNDNEPDNRNNNVGFRLVLATLAAGNVQLPDIGCAEANGGAHPWPRPAGGRANSNCPIPWATWDGAFFSVTAVPMCRGHPAAKASVTLCAPRNRGQRLLPQFGGAIVPAGP
jgi:formylglycine-generating enzyme required for sulfatase activity